MINIIVNAKSPSIGKKEYYLSKPWWFRLLFAHGLKNYAESLAAAKGLTSGGWMLVTPVQFYTTHNDSLIIHVDENKKAFQILKEFIHQDGGELHEYDAQYWLMKLPDFPYFYSTSIFDVFHQSLKPFLDEFPKEWRRWMTEVQMLFQSHHIEHINGVWLWGQGSFALLPHIRVYHDMQAFQGLEGFVKNISFWSADQKPNKDEYLLVSKDYSKEIQPVIEKSLWGFEEIHWWWNNMDDLTPAKSWWKRLNNKWW